LRIYSWRWWIDNTGEMGDGRWELGVGRRDYKDKADLKSAKPNSYPQSLNLSDRLNHNLVYFLISAFNFFLIRMAAVPPRNVPTIVKGSGAGVDAADFQPNEFITLVSAADIAEIVA
jgi:hypothetical protein